MKNTESYKCFTYFIVAIIIINLTMFAAIQYKKSKAKYESESLCIKEWIELGIERKYIHRSNGDCFYSKTFGKN
jgi:hypothetical protein